VTLYTRNLCVHYNSPSIFFTYAADLSLPSDLYVTRGLPFHHGRIPPRFICCKVSLSGCFLRLNTSPMITSRDSIISEVIMDCQSDTDTHLFCMQRTKNLREITNYLFYNIEQFSILLIKSILFNL